MAHCTVPEARNTSHLNTAVAPIRTVRFLGSVLKACWARVPGNIKQKNKKKGEAGALERKHERDMLGFHEKRWKRIRAEYV